MKASSFKFPTFTGLAYIIAGLGLHKYILALWRRPYWMLQFGTIISHFRSSITAN